MYFVHVDILGDVVLAQSCQRPLRSLPVFLGFGVFDKIFAMFVHTEIGEMHESFFNILCSGCILTSCKSRQPLPEHVNTERVIRSYNDIYPQIVFEVINEMRVCYIF